MKNAFHLVVAAAIAAAPLFGTPAFAQRSSIPSALSTAPLATDAQPTAFDPTLGREYPLSTRVMVSDPTEEKPGTLTIDTQNRYMYLSLPGGQAVRYDVGVGREGFSWSGRARVGRKAEWPTWTPPAEMIKRRPDLPKFMAGGLDNPLGARAMYLYDGSRDTMFRIHGSNEPWTIGTAVSSGCIRMTNDDVEDLYERVPVGATVNVI